MNTHTYIGNSDKFSQLFQRQSFTIKLFNVLLQKKKFSNIEWKFKGSAES